MTVRVAEVDAAATTELRRMVLRPAWQPGTPMSGDDDPDAVHIAAVDGNQVVGTCVLLPNPCPHHPDVEHAWQLRGMATAEGRRGRGVGAAVLAEAVAAVGRRGGRLLWCKARVTAAAFYAAQGFDVDGEDYLEPETGLLHRDMSCVPASRDVVRDIGPRSAQGRRRAAE